MCFVRLGDLMAELLAGLAIGRGGGAIEQPHGVDGEDRQPHHPDGIGEGFQGVHGRTSWPMAVMPHPTATIHQIQIVSWENNDCDWAPRAFSTQSIEARMQATKAENLISATVRR